MATQECPCGYLGDPRKACVCTPPQVMNYIARISGPLLDRLDIQVNVPALDFDQLSAPPTGEDSASVRVRVNAARARQTRRLRGSAGGPHCNAQMGPSQIREHCALDRDGLALLKAAVDRLGLSARGFDRLLKVARTVADLDGQEAILVRHLAESIQYRGLDREGMNGRR